MAGDFELFRGPVRDQVRVIKSSLSAAHRCSSFASSKRREQVVKEGKRELTDIDYQLRVAYPAR